MIPDFHFETLILAGEFLGIKDRLFQEIFSFKPWLNHVKKQEDKDQKSKNVTGKSIFICKL